jgi:hypothetical protein
MEYSSTKKESTPCIASLLVNNDNIEEECSRGTCESKRKEKRAVHKDTDGSLEASLVSVNLAVTSEDNRDSDDNIEDIPTLVKSTDRELILDELNLSERKSTFRPKVSLSLRKEPSPVSEESMKVPEDIAQATVLPQSAQFTTSTKKQEDESLVSRVYREMAQLALERRSLGVYPSSSLSLASPPYFHTAHRAEERRKNSQIRLLRDSDFKLLLRPMDLPIFEHCTVSHASATHHRSKKNDRPEVADGDCPKNCLPVKTRQKSVNVSIKKESRCPGAKKLKAKRVEKSSGPIDFSVTIKDKIPGVNPRTKQFRRSVDSSLQCSLIGDNTCRFSKQHESTEVSLSSTSYRAITCNFLRVYL